MIHGCPRHHETIARDLPDHVAAQGLARRDFDRERPGFSTSRKGRLRGSSKITGSYWHSAIWLWVFILPLFDPGERETYRGPIPRRRTKQHPIKLICSLGMDVSQFSTCSYLVDYFG